MEHKDFKQRIEASDSNIEIIGIYENRDKEIECRCKVCGNIWFPKGRNLLRGRTRCPECAKKNGKSRAKLTHEEFVSRCSVTSPTVKICGVYKSMDEHVDCECITCGTLFKQKPHKLLYSNTICPNCFKHTKHYNVKKTHEKFLDDLHGVTDKIEILSEYVNAKTHVLCKCKVCGHEWRSKPLNLLSGYGCRECGNKRTSERQRKTKEEVSAKIHNILPNINIVGEYVSSKTPIECMCKDCGTIWYPITSNLLKGEGCPHCSCSHGENTIRNYLDSNSINYKYQKRFDDLVGVGGGKLSYDFYLPDYNLLIEYQGIQHIKPVSKFGGELQFKTQQEHDMRKRNYADNNGYNFLEIWYYEKNIETILNNSLSIILPVTTTA